MILGHLVQKLFCYGGAGGHFGFDANMAVTGVARLGIHQKSIKYALTNIYTNFGAFGRI